MNRLGTYLLLIPRPTSFFPRRRFIATTTTALTTGSSTTSFQQVVSIPLQRAFFSLPPSSPVHPLLVSSALVKPRTYIPSRLMSAQADIVNPEVHCLPHLATSTCCYVVSCPKTKKCALIDTVVDFEAASGSVDYKHTASVLDYVQQQGLVVEYIMETHTHADHMTAGYFLRKAVQNKTTYCASKDVISIQKLFGDLFNLTDKECPRDGSQFDKLLVAGDKLALGELIVNVLATPGHTNDSLTFHIGNCLFVGDTLFMPDIGGARCDFPQGNAKQMFDSCQTILSFPPKTRMFVGHDYPARRDFRWETSVEEQKATNKLLKDGTDVDTYVKGRETRDATLSAPHLIMPSLQMNIRAGQFPAEEANGVAYLKIPINQMRKDGKKGMPKM